MTMPADVARNAAAVRNLAARLERLGYTGDSHAEAEAITRQLTADRWQPLEPAPAPRGPASTARGRAAARELYEQTRREKEQAE